MKQIYFLACALLLLAGCNNRQNNAQGRTAVMEEDVTVVDTHNAQNSLDVNGTYSGTLPAGTFEGELPSASGPGMDVKITLSGDTYRKSIKYLNQPDTTFESTGRFTWDQNGSIITLQGEEAPNKYFVGENQLYHLDMDGNRITGDMADHYILRKR